MTDSYILCEGYHDRAFWAGLLMCLGCIDPGDRGHGVRAPVFDPWGNEVKGRGQFAYRSVSGGFIRVVPAGGKEKILPLARIRLRQRTKDLSNLILSVDSDQNADGTPAVNPLLTHATVQQTVIAIDAASIIQPNGDVISNSGATTVTLTRWEAPDAPVQGLPNQHALERLLCASVMAAYPPRGPAVQHWLDNRPAAPVAGPKEYAFSYLAGWYADLGSYEAFCTRLWADPVVVRQMEARLRACGIWQLAQRIST
jgi:hypothetical protein